MREEEEGVNCGEGLAGHVNKRIMAMDRATEGCWTTKRAKTDRPWYSQEKLISPQLLKNTKNSISPQLLLQF